MVEQFSHIEARAKHLAKSTKKCLGVYLQGIKADLHIAGVSVAGEHLLVVSVTGQRVQALQQTLIMYQAGRPT